MTEFSGYPTAEDLKHRLAAEGLQYTDEQLHSILQFVKQTGSVQSAMAALQQLELLRKAA